MAPKTYPQQVADLKAEKQELLDQNSKLQEQLALVPELQEELKFVKGELEKATALKDRSVGTQAEWNDLKQRADGNESQVNDLHARNRGILEYAGRLENQLDLLGKDQFKIKDLEKKLEFLAEELKTANARVAQGNQQKQDEIIELTKALESQSNKVRDLMMNNRVIHSRLQELEAIIREAPDVITKLKSMV